MASIFHFWIGIHYQYPILVPPTLFVASREFVPYCSNIFKFYCVPHAENPFLFSTFSNWHSFALELLAKNPSIL
jgi:hypothetical protein